MIEKNKCIHCNYVYEVIWDDDTSEYFADVVEDDDDFQEKEELYPEYCPFCGIHREYGSEADGDDDY